MRRTRPLLTLIAVLLAGIAACSSSTAPNDTTRPPTELNVIRLAASSRPLFNAADSFYAKKGSTQWSRGFEIVEVTDKGIRVRRTSDREVIPAEFAAEDVRPAHKRANDFWWM